MKKKNASNGLNRFNSSTEGLLRSTQVLLAMTFLGILVVASVMVSGCGKTNSGSATLQHGPYVIALSQPAGSVPGSLYALSPTAGTVEKLSLNVGTIPNSMLLDGNNLYVVNAGDSTISVITITESTSNIYMTNNGVISLISGSYPGYLTVTTVNGVDKGYASLTGTNQVAVLNLDKNTLLSYISVSAYSTWEQKFQTHPYGIAVVNGKIMVANFGMSYTDYTTASPGMVSVINPASDVLLDPITTTGVNLQAVEPLTTTGLIVIAGGNYGMNNGFAELFNAGYQETKSIPLNTNVIMPSQAVALSPTGTAYIALSSMIGYETIDTNTGTFITTTDLTKQDSGVTGFSIASIKLAPDGKLWATVPDWANGVGTIFEIDPTTNTVIKTFKISEPAQDVVFVY